MDCVFCAIVRGETPAAVVYEDEMTVAFMDINPANPGHIGLDIAARLYDPLYAAAPGTVSFTGPNGGYGNLVVINHPDGWQTWYAHLSSISVAVGQDLAQGEIIGAAGSTGYSTGPHLHFELRYEGRPVDPLVYLR